MRLLHRGRRCTARWTSSPGDPIAVDIDDYHRYRRRIRRARLRCGRPAGRALVAGAAGLAGAGHRQRLLVQRRRKEPALSACAASAVPRGGAPRRHPGGAGYRRPTTRFGKVPPITDMAVAAMRFFASEPVYHPERPACRRAMRDGPRTARGAQRRRNAPTCATPPHWPVPAWCWAATWGAPIRSPSCPTATPFSRTCALRQRGGAHRAWLIAVDVAPVEPLPGLRASDGPCLCRRADARRGRAHPGVDAAAHPSVPGRHNRFAALLPDTPTTWIDAAQMDALVQRLRRPFDCLGIPLTIQPGIGLLNMDVSEVDGGDPLRLVMSASHAAQHSVRGWSIYERSQDERHRQEFFLVTELAAALTDAHRAGPALPAAGRPGQRPLRGGGGAGALAAPHHGHHSAGALHPRWPNRPG